MITMRKCGEKCIHLRAAIIAIHLHIIYHKINRAYRMFRVDVCAMLGQVLTEAQIEIRPIGGAVK
jgi:hypothetical protein